MHSPVESRSLSVAMPLDPPPAPGQRVVRGACPHDCPDTCALLTTVEDGRAIAVRGAADHPATAGVLCTKVARYLERTYSDQRVLHPMRRVGRKGEGRFERISWDEALAEIADALRRDRGIARRSAGDRPVQLCGHDGPAAVRLDGPALLPPAGRIAARPHDLRVGRQGRLDAPSSAPRSAWTSSSTSNSRLILIWGSNPIASNLHFWTQRAGSQAARREADRDRPLSQRHRREMPRAHRAAARHRRRAGARADARADRARICSTATTSSATRWASPSSRSAPRQWTPERTAATCGIAADAGDRARARLRHDRRPPRSASTTACSAPPAAATRCARSPACRR